MSEVLLTDGEVRALLDLLRVMPQYIDLSDKQIALAERLKRKLRPLVLQ